MVAHIYQIRNTANQQIYIGSTRQKAPRSRWLTGHIRDLRNGNHGNQILQHSFNKHGESAFVFEVLEQFEWSVQTDIEAKEQHYINTLDPHYNIVRNVSRSADFPPREIKGSGKNYILTRPDGQEIEVTNLKKFCRENGLGISMMRSISKGRVYNCNGWLCRPTTMTKDEFEAVRRKPSPSKTKKNELGLSYEMMSPEGLLFTGYKVKDMARAHDLDYSCLLGVLHGRFKHTNGWRIRYEGKGFAYAKKPNKVTKRNADGTHAPWFIKDIATSEIICLTILREFCNVHGLSKDSPRHVLYAKGLGPRKLFSRYEDFRDVPLRTMNTVAKQAPASS